MKIILQPIFKYILSFIIGLYVLLITLCFYPLVVIWELKFMTWGEYMAYNYCCGVESPDEKIEEMLLKESFFSTMIRWINFEYGILLINNHY
jgi:hypothetical protein